MKIIQIYDGWPNLKYQSSMYDIETNRPPNTEYLLVTVVPENIERTNDPRSAIDIYRFQYLMNSPDTLYLDCDCTYGEKGMPKFEKTDKPWFTNATGYPDIPSIYSGIGNHDFFERLLADYKPGCPMGWFVNYLFTHRDEYYLIPNGHFIHKHLYRRAA